MGFTPLSAHREYTFPEGAFDVRGWAVRTMADEEKVGRVEDVLIDDAGAIRYLDVALGRFRKHVLLPVGQARVDDEDDVVWVPGMTKEQFGDIPAYTHDVGVLTPEYEARLTAAYTGDYGGGRSRAARRSRVIGAGTPPPERLASLRELEDFEVAAEDPDPRGWEVIAGDSRSIGRIHELIVDTTAMKVRYLDCKVDEETLGLSREDRHILIPAGYARLDEPNQKVIVDAVTSTDVRNLPVYGGLPVSHVYEQDLQTRFTGGQRGESAREGPRYEEERFYAPRREGDGSERERGD